jgi:hypothetical protein
MRRLGIFAVFFWVNLQGPIAVPWALKTTHFILQHSYRKIYSEMFVFEFPARALFIP